MGVLFDMATAWAAQFKSPIPDWILAISTQVDAGAAGGSPTGPAGGSLAGTYPNPSIAAGAIGTAEIANGAIINADVNAAAAIDVTKLAGGTVVGQILTNQAGNIPTWSAPLLNTPQEQIRYVSKGGNDATGNGSINLPFLTIQAAITSIADESATKQYFIHVGPGIYTTAFVMVPWIFIGGESRDATIISPVQANWIGADFAGAAALVTGIEHCTIGSPIAVNFAAVGSTGAGVFRMFDTSLDTGATMTFTGATIANVCELKDTTRVGAVTALTHTFANIQAWLADCFILSDNMVLTSNLAAVLTMRISNVNGGLGTWNINATGATALFQVLFLGTSIFNPEGGLVITGEFCSVRGGASLARSILGPDANTTFDYNGTVAGVTKLVGGGFNLIHCVPTANRTYTFNNPSQQGTRVRIKNGSPTFLIDVVFPAPSITTGSPTYIPPGGYLDLFVGQAFTDIQSVTQAGTTVLVAGVSPAILADITANSRITVTPKVFTGAAGVGAALQVDRVVGTRAGGGSFLVKSIAQATGAVVVTDLGTYDWEVVN